MMKTQSVTQQEYRNTIGHFTTGVSVITTKYKDQYFVITASSVASVSLEPPMLLVCVNQNTGTRKAISEAKVFSVNILHQEQGDVARRFATPNIDKFENVEIRKSFLNLPV